jgi:hypothetical protein
MCPILVITYSCGQPTNYGAGTRTIDSSVLIAPTIKEFEIRVNSYHEIEHKWPENTQDLFEQGPLFITVKSGSSSYTQRWDAGNFTAQLLRIDKNAPVYKIRFGEYVREIEFPN